MPLIEQEFLKPGSYKVGHGWVNYSKEDLGRIADNTNRMISDKRQVPVFPYHPEISDESGPKLPGSQTDARDNLGWLHSVSQSDNGSLSYKLDIEDKPSVQRIQDGRIRFTSPELHPSYTDKTGKFYGPAIRHVSLTPKPRNPNQGDMTIVAFSEDDMAEPYSVSLAQFADNDKKLPGAKGDEPAQDPVTLEGAGTGTDQELYVDSDSEGDAGLGDTQSIPQETQPQDEPESPMWNKQNVIMSRQIASDLEAAGISAPVADPMKDFSGWLAQLCAALKQKVRTEAEELSKQLDNRGGQGNLGVTEESSYMNQFSELTKHDDPTVRKMAVQFSEIQEAKAADEAKRKHDDTVRKVKSSKIVPAIKEKLLEGILVEQFSEENDGPTFTLDQVVTLLEENTPPGLQFTEDGALPEDHQEGKDFFKEEQVEATGSQPNRNEAKSIVDELRDDQYRRPTIGQEVANA